MYGTVVAVEDQDVVLEIAPGVEVRFLRRAIMAVVPDPSAMEAEEPAPEHSETLDEAEDDAATGGSAGAGIRVNGGPNDKRIEG